MNYEQKYLKYKKKYLDLKGGAEIIIPNTNSEINVLMITHNARMRCFIDTLKDVIDVSTNSPISNIMKYKLGNSNQKEIRFMNSAILKVSLNKGDPKGTISLFYSGEVNNRKNSLYFVNSSSTNTEDTIFGEYDFDYAKSFGINTLSFDINFYIVRHGEGTHNLKDNPKIYSFVTRTGTDPKLTFDGEMQAKRAGDFIKKLNPPIKFNFVFVSKLNRTRQTGYLILKNSGNLNAQSKFIVLPCSHELLYYSKEGSNCDLANNMIPIAPENVAICESQKKTLDTCIPECCIFNMSYFDKNKYKDNILQNKKLDQDTINKIITEINEQEKYDVGDIDIKIDWEYFNNFYYKNDKKCRFTNMIKEAVDILTLLNKTI